ncbi:PhnE/PtxC family ABC transporter permease [Mycoplasma elephantis]|uniref:PhnE/PtxC family ABC transporter permease n=1 Tax=Mycoplasma elephantis TaxID=114882 RepID=UPI00069189EB|nr:ABC transporter permease subunit [Mycoplasma elephantis]
MNKQKKRSLRYYFERFIDFFNPKFIDINGQKVTKKFPWLLIFSWIIGSALLIYLINKVHPDFSYAYKMFGQLYHFTEFNKTIYIGNGDTTPLDTFVLSLELLWETIAYSVLGTLLGIIISVPLALFSSKNFIKSPFIYYPTRIFMSFVRAIPPIVFAFLIFQLVSPSLAASLSIAIFVSTLMTKWLYEDLDTYDVSTYYGMLSIGNTRFQAFKKSILPYLMKRIVTYGLYTFEMVVRFAAILEVVGIETIGSLMNDKYAVPNHWSHLSIVLWILVAFMIILEVFNYLIKKYLLEYTPKHPNIDSSLELKDQIDSLKKQKPKIFYAYLTLIILLAILTIATLFEVEWKIANDIKLRNFGNGLRKLFNPDWTLFNNWDSGNNPINLGLDALVVAVVSSVLGLLFALILGILAARKISGHFSLIFKFIIIVIRAIPPFTLALLFLVMYHYSLLFVGVLALGIHSIGMLGKLVTESIERIDNEVFVSLDSVGANWFHKIKYVVIKEIMPQTLSNFLYRIEINFKTTVVIGAVGASPFGQQISIYSADTNNWDRLSSYLIVTIVLLLIIEQISNILRKKLIKGYFFEKNFIIKRNLRHSQLLKSLSISYITNVEYNNKLSNAQFNIAKNKKDNLLTLNKEYANKNEYLCDLKNKKKENILIRKTYKEYKKEFQKMKKKVFMDIFTNTNKPKWQILARYKIAIKSLKTYVSKYFSKGIHKPMDRQWNAWWL